MPSVEEQYEQKRQAVRQRLDEQQRSRILALATDFPRLWKDPQTPHRERKRMARLLLEDVTLLKEHAVVTAQVRFRGGATHCLKIPGPKPAWMIRKTPPEVVQLVDELLEEHTDADIAEQLNQRGLRSGTGRTFLQATVRSIREAYGLKSRYQRLRDRGMLTQDEVAQQLGIQPYTVKMWRRRGFLISYRYNDKGQRLYAQPGPDAPVKGKHKKAQIGLNSS